MWKAQGKKDFGSLGSGKVTVSSGWWDQRDWRVQDTIQIETTWRILRISLMPTGSHWRVLNREWDEQTCLLKILIVFLLNQKRFRVFVFCELLWEMINTQTKVRGTGSQDWKIFLTPLKSWKVESILYFTGKKSSFILELCRELGHQRPKFQLQFYN